MLAELPVQLGKPETAEVDPLLLERVDDALRVAERYEPIARRERRRDHAVDVRKAQPPLELLRRVLAGQESFSQR